MIEIENNQKSLRLFMRFAKIISLTIWSLPIYIYCNWFMLPFAKSFQGMIGLYNELFIKHTGYSKYDVYLTVFPSMFYMIFIVVIFRNALRYIDIEKNIVNSKRFDNIIFYHHLYLLLGFVLVLVGYYLGINKFFTDF